MSDVSKDAIKLLQEIQSVYFDKQSDCLDESNLIDVAIEALEKQIPKKVIFDKYRLNDEYLCPNCDMRYWRKGGVWHCIRCGQKLDWED